ncbi:MAG: helix-turn-helix transcriptional regulator [Clostridia bacterium]|nr:helix-turn-helix transcriptional regulator [Clostridia bacterium]
MLQSKLGSSLYHSRINLDYTQNQVAQAVSISVRWYQRIEKGEKLPSSIVLIRLVLFLHIDLEEYRGEVGLLD